MRTKTELKQIALDIFNKRIFHNEMVRCPEDVQRVFLPLTMMKPEQVDEMMKDPPALIFQYIDQASTRCFNDMPMFLSYEILTQEEFPLVKKTLDELISAVDNVLTKDDHNEHSRLPGQ